MARLAVFLSSYNRPQGLKRAIASVLGQTYQDIQLVILDDNSTNTETIKIIDEYTCHYNVTTFVNNGEYDKSKICSFGALLNRGMQLIDSEYCSYLCDGVQYLPQRCSRLIAHLDACHSADLAWDQQHIIHEGSAGNALQLEIREEHPEAVQIWQGQHWLNRLRNANSVDHNSVLERRNDINWSEDIADWNCIDWTRWKRVAASGRRFDFVPWVGEIKHVGPGSTGKQIAAGKSLTEVIGAMR